MHIVTVETDISKIPKDENGRIRIPSFRESVDKSLLDNTPDYQRVTWIKDDLFNDGGGI